MQGDAFQGWPNQEIDQVGKEIPQELLALNFIVTGYNNNLGRCFSPFFYTKENSGGQSWVYSLTPPISPGYVDAYIKVIELFYLQNRENNRIERETLEVF